MVKKWDMPKQHSTMKYVTPYRSSIQPWHDSLQIFLRTLQIIPWGSVNSKWLRIISDDSNCRVFAHIDSVQSICICAIWLPYEFNQTIPGKQIWYSRTIFLLMRKRFENAITKKYAPFFGFLIKRVQTLNSIYFLQIIFCTSCPLIIRAYYWNLCLIIWPLTNVLTTSSRIVSISWGVRVLCSMI